MSDTPGGNSTGQRFEQIKEVRRKQHEMDAERRLQLRLESLETDSNLSMERLQSNRPEIEKRSGSDIRKALMSISISDAADVMLSKEQRQQLCSQSSSKCGGDLVAPTILHPNQPRTNAAVRSRKRSSILKKRDDSHPSGGVSVSFDLDPNISGRSSPIITRTKSTDSNLSCDTETGYWSGGEGHPTTTGILKTRSKDRDFIDDVDHKSILKDYRRSSLGSSVASTCTESSLHSILKRKHSYDSSTLLSNVTSLSLGSLECLSPEPKPILKKKSSSEELDDHEWSYPKPILKKNSKGDQSHSSSSDGLDDGNIRPILKKTVKVDEKGWEYNEGINQTGRSILKRMDNEKGSSTRSYSVDEPNCYYGDPDDHSNPPESSDRSGFLKIRHGSLPTPDHLNLLSAQMDKCLIRSDSEEDILMSMSVAEKRSLFLQFVRDRESSNRSGSTAKRHVTQPVTLEEIEKASQLIQNHISNIPLDELRNSIMKDEPKGLLGSMLGELSDRVAPDGKKSDPIPRRGSLGSRPSSATVSNHNREVPVFPLSESREEGLLVNSSSSGAEEMDPSKLSLRERVRMFDKLACCADDSFPFRPIKRPVTSRRFQTQPVTNFEHRSIIQDCVRSSEAIDKPLLSSFVPSRRRDLRTEVASLTTPINRVEFEEVEGQPDFSKSFATNPDDARSRNITNHSECDSSNDEKGDEENYEESSFLKRRLKKATYDIGSDTGGGPGGMEEDAIICERSGSISEKIAALRTNGETSWKKRFCRPITKKVLVDEADNHRNIDTCANNKDVPPTVVANRLSLLEKSKDGWKKRVSENDATFLTVQSKLEKAGKLNESSLGDDRKENGIANSILTPTKFIGKGFKNSPLTQELEKKLLNINKKLPSSLQSTPKPEVPSEVTKEKQDQVVRNIQSNDSEEFRRFFPSLDESPVLPIGETVISGVCLDELQVFDRQLLGVRRNIRVTRTHTSSRNPIKTLASRLTEQSYVETKAEIVEKEDIRKRIQAENLGTSSHLSIEALAGLASREDFTAVKLKKAQSQTMAVEYPYPLLIRIKGKRFVQIRLVPPLASSVGSGDCFILATKDQVFQYIGDFANRMEKVKLSDVLAQLLQRHDLGICLSHPNEVVTLEEPLEAGRVEVKAFFDILGGEGTAADDKLGDEADEEYELGVIRTNRVFEVDPIKEELSPVLNEGGWGSQPKFSMLQEDRVLVFDFGSEMYVWSGSRADVDLKRKGCRLGQEMFDDSYNFSEVGHEFSPLGSLVSGDRRPNWCWFKRVTHHMEPVLFQEKFADWPDESTKKGRSLRTSETNSSGGYIETGYYLSSCDVTEMESEVQRIQDPKLELEGFNVGRGFEIHDESERRHYTITTTDVRVWRISEFSKIPVDCENCSNFYSTETYVVRWDYTVTQVGRDLKGNQSRFGTGVLGRPRIAYFYWHGKDSKPTEQGGSALMTVEMDQEKGPQVRVVQGQEPPSFLSLFRGSLFIHSGSSEDIRRPYRLYVAMGNDLREGYFIEVPSAVPSLRSRGSFLLVDEDKGAVKIWHGCGSSEISHKIAQNGAKCVIANSPKLANLKEIHEGGDSNHCWDSLGVQSREEWSTLRLVENSAHSSSQINVFQFLSLKGKLEAKMVLSTSRKVGVASPFPILQEDIYGKRQPALFLIVCGADAWLWHGWHPRGDDDNENIITGSGEYRWAAERKGALETGIDFVQRTGGKGFMVHAGLEPSSFQALFPYWSIHGEAREVNFAGGKLDGDSQPFTVGLEPFLKRTYTVDELQERPEGVDVLRLEMYLSDVDFENLLKMSREDFNRLQQWRRDELKKQVGLF